MKYYLLFKTLNFLFQLLVLIVGCCLIRHVAQSEGKAKSVVNY